MKIKCTKRYFSIKRFYQNIGLPPSFDEEKQQKPARPSKRQYRENEDLMTDRNNLNDFVDAVGWRLLTDLECRVYYHFFFVTKSTWGMKKKATTTLALASRLNLKPVFWAVWKTNRTSSNTRLLLKRSFRIEGKRVADNK